MSSPARPSPCARRGFPIHFLPSGFPRGCGSLAGATGMYKWLLSRRWWW